MESTSRRGRILGLDAGERRIGVAISDPDLHFAIPLRSIERDRHRGEFGVLQDLARREDVTEAVVGLPLSLSGEAGSQAERARALAREIEERLQLTVHMYDERLSTHEATRLGGEGRATGRRRQTQRANVDTDALAASIILQAFLDRLRFSEAPAE